MKIIHTSDWHLGSSLYGQKRYKEYESFLKWLVHCVQEEHIDVILIAGDVFDNSTPSNQARTLYYQFLHEVTILPDVQVVITAGNHDSPTMLNAPQALLRELDIHVIGAVTENPEDEVLILNDPEGKPALIICAVPYLRDRDIRLSEAGESIEDKTRKLQDGVRQHYQEVCTLAEAKRTELGGGIPIVGMGHLFVTGGRTVEGDGVRELYVGNLARINADTLFEGMDYFALGHLHLPQVIAGKENCRYCGSPLMMGFGETNQKKQIITVEFTPGEVLTEVREIPVPRFQELVTVRGDLASIEAEVQELASSTTPVWIEVIVDGELNAATVQARLREMTQTTDLEILRVKSARSIELALHQIEEGESLSDLTERDVFMRCLDLNKVPECEREVLIDAFDEICEDICEEDIHAA